MKAKEMIQKNAQSVSVKLALIAALALLLLIPANMVKSLINERQFRRDQTLTELTDLLGTAQTVAGPVISVPYRTYEKTADGTKTLWHQAHFLPETLRINGQVNPQIRYRSIYKIIAYESQLQVSGTFSPMQLQAQKVAPEDIFWDQAVLSLGISDMKGIRSDILVNWDSEPFKCQPGVAQQTFIGSGVNTPIPVKPEKAYAFQFNLHLNGTEKLHFVPVGSHTQVKLQSDWDTPKFTGAFAPDNPEITNNGFTSEWTVLELNRQYPQQWTDNQYEIQSSAFGVDLIFAVDIYQKNMRSVKYALLFIALTFIIVFFAEYLQNKRIHPVHYLLVGMALVVFYSLLFSLSEHMAFQWAYLMAAVAIIGLIAAFLHSLLKNVKVTLIISLILVFLYAFLYVILEIFGYSLLLGNIGLVVILGALMYFSRKIDWYGEKSR